MFPAVLNVYNGYRAVFMSTLSYGCWTFHGGPLPSNAHVIKNTTLIIEKVKPSNRGYYSYEGFNKYNKKFIAHSILKVISKFKY